jgi:hypothetical protein
MEKILKQKKLLAIIFLGLAALTMIISGIGIKANNGTLETFWTSLVVFGILAVSVVLGMFLPLFKKVGVAASYALFAFFLISLAINEVFYFSGASSEEQPFAAVDVFFGLAGVLGILAFLAFVLYYILPVGKEIVGMIGFFLVLTTVLLIIIGSIILTFAKNSQGGSYWTRGLRYFCEACALGGSYFAYEWAKGDPAESK